MRVSEDLTIWKLEVEITFISQFVLTLDPFGQISRRARPRTRRTPLATYTRRGHGSSPRRKSVHGSSFRSQHRSGQHHPRRPDGSPQNPEQSNAPALDRSIPPENSRALYEEHWPQGHIQLGGRLLRGCSGRTSRQNALWSSKNTLS